ncbi:unnamed protein product [Periconia digitata]|uniref:Uncharacterized protein n=1 Tax=Periconia digitata TaxID=1303443 RepID=A0A9W4UFX8_9PLEO|nr:unnamed protein product [Periconia digitata]
MLTYLYINTTVTTQSRFRTSRSSPDSFTVAPSHPSEGNINITSIDCMDGINGLIGRLTYLCTHVPTHVQDILTQPMLSLTTSNLPQTTPSSLAVVRIRIPHRTQSFPILRNQSSFRILRHDNLILIILSVPESKASTWSKRLIPQASFMQN